MRILTSAQIKKAEQTAFERYFTEAQLMKKAGEKCFEKIVEYYGDQIRAKKVSVVCGNGKNAGDGFVIAQKLKQYGAEPEIVIADKFPTIPEPAMYLDEAEKAGVKAVAFEEAVLSDVLVVDCIFGIGFHGEPKEPFSKVFDAVNQCGAVVVSIDTPSGTNASEGTVYKAVKADLTIAISTLKYCHILPPANHYCGKAVVINIGLPEDCFEDSCPHTITKKYVKSCFPKRNKNSNKGQNGHLLNICGSYLMPGAAVICAKAALKTGVGLLKCVFPRSVYPVMTSHLVQPVFSPVSENEEKTLSIGSLNRITEELEWADCVAIGCGLGKNDDTQVIVNQVIRSSEVLRSRAERRQYCGYRRKFRFCKCYRKSGHGNGRHRGYAYRHDRLVYRAGYGLLFRRKMRCVYSWPMWRYYRAGDQYTRHDDRGYAGSFGSADERI